MHEELNYEEHEQNIMEYEQKYNLEFPRRDSYTYLYIENIEDYEYTNSIAYEMVRRNEEFKELTKIPYITKTPNWKIKILELGLNPKINIFPTCPALSINFNNEQQRFFYESWLSHTVDDIKDGLEKLIEYYFSKNKIFLLKNKNESNNPEDYVKINNIPLSDILGSPSDYYIPCSLTKAFIKIDTKDMVRMQQICNEIPLRILEKDFLNSIKFTDTKYKYTQLMPWYSRPEITFPYSDIVNIPVNLNLENGEIIAYILKAKEEYKKRNLTIKYPLALIGNEYEESIPIKSAKEFPTEKDKRKRAVADAFYVYDLMKTIDPYFKKKTKMIRDERDKKVQEINNNYKHIKNAKKERDEESKECKESYSMQIKQYSKDELKLIISVVANLSLHKVERYANYMQECIDNKKYIELITAKTTS